MGVRRSCDESGTEAFLGVVGVGVRADNGRAKGSALERKNQGRGGENYMMKKSKNEVADHKAC